VDHSPPPRLPNPNYLRSDANDRVHKGPGWPTSAGMNHYAGGFIENEEVGVLEQYVELRNISFLLG
jgi:hypothetical protein